MKVRTNSSLMSDLHEKVTALSKTDDTVIFVGEPGSGKRFLAQLVHKLSPRADANFYTFNCMGIDENVWRDAFQEKLLIQENRLTLKFDAIEKAAGGTLFLDQFSELSENTMHHIISLYISAIDQLFRYNRKYKPRLVIALTPATFKQITQNDIWNQLLRQLLPVVIKVPPLRDRKDELPTLISQILCEVQQVYPNWNLQLSLSENAFEMCVNYHWPGNIYQLKNALLQGVVMSNGKTIEPQHLPFSMHWKLPYSIGKKM